MEGNQSLKPSSRTIFIGDVHGCLSELKALVERLAPGPDDRVILLGDLINRGPDSAGVIRYVHQAGFESLMGNHDDEYLRECESKKEYIALRREIGPELHKWMRKRPLFIESDDFLAVHAGLEPGKHPSESRRGLLLNIRTWDGRGEVMNDPNNPPWYEFYHGKKPVLYGHWARRGLTIRANTIGLDSGCCYGRALSAWILETRELLQETAHRHYYIPPSLRRENAGKSTLNK